MVLRDHGFPAPGGGAFGVEAPVTLYRGSPEQTERYPKPTIEHAWSTFSAISEPAGGSDPARVSAEPRPWLGLAATAPEHPVAWPAWRTSSSPGHRTGSGWRPRGS